MEELYGLELRETEVGAVGPEDDDGGRLASWCFGDGGAECGEANTGGRCGADEYGFISWIVGRVE